MADSEPSSRPRGYRAWTFILTLAAIATIPVTANAELLEARTYLDIGESWVLAPDQAPDFKLGAFVREESRFRESGLMYVKAFAGARLNIFPWLRTALYYAHKDFPGSGKHQADMAVLDVFVSFHFGPMVMLDKNGFEGHLTDQFFRYRNALELRWESPLGWLSAFVRGELRVDSDAARVNMLDAWAGLMFKIPDHEHAPLSVRLFYGYETSHRGQSDWTGVHIIGLELAAHI